MSETKLPDLQNFIGLLGQLRRLQNEKVAAQSGSERKLEVTLKGTKGYLASHVDKLLEEWMGRINEGRLEKSEWDDLKNVAIAVRQTQDSTPLFIPLDTFRTVCLISRNPLKIVHIYSESGTGKHALAELIHEMTQILASKPLEGKTFHQSSISFSTELSRTQIFGIEGKRASGVEQSLGYLEICKAPGSTWFFDEIHDLPDDLQNDLKLVFQNRLKMEFKRIGSTEVQTFSGRLITGSNKDIFAKMQHDFAARIGGLIITLPSLKDWNRRIRNAPDFFRPFLEHQHEELKKQWPNSFHPKAYSDENWKTVFERSGGLSNWRSLSSTIEADFLAALNNGQKYMTPSASNAALEPGQVSSISQGFAQDFIRFLEGYEPGEFQGLRDAALVYLACRYTEEPDESAKSQLENLFDKYFKTGKRSLEDAVRKFRAINGKRKSA